MVNVGWVMLAFVLGGIVGMVAMAAVCAVKDRDS